MKTPTRRDFIGPNFEAIIKEAQEREELNLLMTQAQVARVLQVSTATVKRLIQIGEIPYINCCTTGTSQHKGVRVSLHDLNDWIASRRTIECPSIKEARVGTADFGYQTEHKYAKLVERVTGEKQKQ